MCRGGTPPPHTHTHTHTHIPLYPPFHTERRVSENEEEGGVKGGGGVDREGAREKEKGKQRGGVVSRFGLSVGR